jgi:hypothetical protein
VVSATVENAHDCVTFRRRRTLTTNIDPIAIRRSAATTIPAMSAPVKAMDEPLELVRPEVPAPVAPFVEPAAVTGAPTATVVTAELEPV